MSPLSPLSLTATVASHAFAERIRIRLFPDPQDAAVVVDRLASIEGPVDIYFWYEGRGDLPQSGAKFMTESLFAPLYQAKEDVTLHLCSFKGWNFTKKLAHMKTSTPLGDAIARIRHEVIKCIDSFAFFNYCLDVHKDNLCCKYIAAELPKKQQTVVSDRKSEMKIGEFFGGKPSLFDCIQDRDVGSAYPLMRYVEGYYLIQELVKKGYVEGEKKIQIAFALPNDECKYYRDFPGDLAKMLQLDFGKLLDGMEIAVSFHFFQYGQSVEARPYKMAEKENRAVTKEEIPTYFRFLQKQPPISYAPRDVLHGLNDRMLSQERDSSPLTLSLGELPLVPTIPRDDIHKLNDDLI